MSSLFNYELDENNIRSTLLNAEPSQFNEADWNEFENHYRKHLSKPSGISSLKLPEIHLNINRNVILPVFFILALVGVSAIMLSFIDFKSDKEQVEKKLDPNPANYQPKTENAVQVNASKAIPEKPKVMPPAIQPAVVTKSLEEVGVIQNEVLVSNNDPASSITKTVSESDVRTNDTENKPAITPMIVNSATTVQTVPQRLRRKRPEKTAPEQIETIKAPALIKTESETTDNEPDLEIKLD